METDGSQSKISDRSSTNLLFTKFHYWYAELQKLILSPSAGTLDQIYVQPDSPGM